MNTTEILAAACSGLGLGIFAAWLGMMGRHAIPRAPWVFHVLLTPPMLVSAASAVAVGVLLLLPDETTFLGLGRGEHAALFAVGQFFTYWILVGYSVFWTVRGRISAGQEEGRVARKLDRAATEAEDRFSEGEGEKSEERERVDLAEAVRRGELFKVRDEIKQELAEIKDLLRRVRDERADERDEE